MGGEGGTRNLKLVFKDFRKLYILLCMHAPVILQVAPSLTNCFPVSGPGNHLYIFVVRDVESGNVYLGLPSENDSHTALGILTRNPLPHLKVYKGLV